MPNLSRRKLLSAAGAFAGTAVFSRMARGNLDYGRPLGPAAGPGSGRLISIDLTAAERMTALECFGGQELPMWTFTEDSYPPVVRMKLGDSLEAKVTNRLPGGEHLSIHWHGLRIANSQDGVPYVTQPPIQPGETFVYRFTPPDTGTFFFHTHCNTAAQLGRGLAGILLVEGDETEPYDADETIVLKDWRVDKDGFMPFLTESGAANAGTFGPVRSANGAIDPEIEVPAGADVRLRILNIDPTRIVGLGIRGVPAEAAVVAVDGCGVPPFPSNFLLLGPAQRADFIIRTPEDGGIVEIIDFRLKKPLTLAHLKSVGRNRRGTPFSPAPLTAPRMPEPDIENATTLPFELASTPGGARVQALADAGSPFVSDLCLSERTFWAINKKSWPEKGHEQLPPPLVQLDHGKTYIFEIANISKQFHPIHMHGHSFKVIGALRSDLPVHRADTMMMVPRERSRIAFVADNPGSWMFHCHVIEHQETGMMAYFRVA